MELYGIHHITAITADARANLDFYTRVLGMRFVKKTVNSDDPSAYHLYYADDAGSPGSVLSFFEYPGIAHGRAGQGMVHRVSWKVGDERALEFWGDRLGALGLPLERTKDSLRFSDPEGLGLELVIDRSSEPSRGPGDPQIPAGAALRGLGGVRVFHSEPATSAAILRELTFVEVTPAVARRAGSAVWRLDRGASSSWLAYDPAPYLRPLLGAGTVHHVGWTTPAAQQSDWRERVAAAGLAPTQIIDRTYFRSVYFREPSGALLELATPGPGFAVDEPYERLGERLQLPPRYEPLRASLEEELTPLRTPDLAA